ncbi:peptidase M15 [Moraxella caviae]|uniref:Peptidase M15 n=1 Tax=Moraxella caviae TaxID=34060 RepID=A0A1T0A3Q1_9GAMM|nr:D-Ala-D-Ala carboxypeptidase family metallohydrolase [Moraxella caviae]OOR90228.1 peptidase M15 [Moraxella caviae]STZ14551.1 Peptidase M15 [Moraxella caviae]VEW12556.1 Peptidase M15 [Moraxella caviae]
MQIKDIQQKIGTTPDGKWGEQSKKALRKALADGMVIQITPNITLNELLASQTASRNRIDNMPDHATLQNLIDSAENLWQPARDILGQPIRITSGYRSPALNKRIGGASNSAHKHGFAIDFSCPAFGVPAKIVPFLVREFKKRGIKFDQAIIEYPKRPNSWVHLAYKHPSGRQRQSSFTIG